MMEHMSWQLLIFLFYILACCKCFADTTEVNGPIISMVNSRPLPRLSRASGGRYDEFRSSEVWKGPVKESETDFSFRHRWKDHSFRTRVVKQVDVPEVRLPEKTGTVRGIFLADVCLRSKFVNCLFGLPYDTLGKLTWTLNHLYENNELNFWTMIGDNLYDEDGSLSDEFFSHISPELLANVPLYAVPGNHDLWTLGVPSTLGNNQFGYGFAQYYMMDVDSTRSNRDGREYPYSFPPTSSPEELVTVVPSADNFFHYSSVGPLGFILFNGANKFEADRFDRACKYFSKDGEGSHVKFVFLLSHWSSQNLGCQENMHTQGVFETMSDPQGPLHKHCYPLAKNGKLYFVDGHQHENKVLGAFGMRVAGQGMIDTGTFGLPLVETRPEKSGHRLLVRYISLAEMPFDLRVHTRFHQLKSCTLKHGMFPCLDRLSFVQTWFNATSSH